MRGQEVLTCDYHCCNGCLHVGGSTSVEFAVANYGCEWIARPMIQWTGRHDVRVPREYERAGAGRAAVPDSPQVADAKTFRTAVHPLAHKAKRDKSRSDQLQATCILRSDRGPCNQFFGELQCARHHETGDQSRSRSFNEVLRRGSASTRLTSDGE